MKQLSVLLFSIVSCTCFAPPTIEEIKNISSRVKPEYQHLSPVHAKVALETGQLQRLAQLGDKTVASTQLLHELFKLQDNRLHPCPNLSKPAAHFTPEIVADLVTALERKILTSDDQKTWRSTLLEKVNMQLKKTSSGRMTTTKLGAFLRILQQAQQEGEPSNIKRYFPHTALLGYVCLKASSRQDLADCFDHMQRNGLDVLSAETPQAMTVARALHETALYTEMDRKFYKGTLPPLAKESDLTFDGTRARDCVDTLIRTFFDHLFYDSTTHRFEPTKKLPSMVKPCPQLLDFYQKYATPSDVNSSPTIAYDWMALTAGRSPVIYRYVPQASRHFVVRPFLSNIIVILNQLLGTEGKTFAQLCQQLSTEARTLACEYEKKREKDIMHITFEEPGQEYTLSMETMPEHGCMHRHIKRIATLETDQQKQMRYALLPTLASDAYDQDTHDLLAVYISQDPAELKKDIQTFITSQDIPLQNLLAFYSLLDIDVENVDLVLFDSVCSKLRQYPQLKPFLLNLIFDLHDDDTFYYYYNIKYLAKHRVWKVDLEFQDTINNLLNKINNETYKEKARAVLAKNGFNLSSS